MWIARNKDEERIFSEISGYSDRAAAIVIGSMLEAHLESALKNRMHNDPETLQEMFRPSGPLGTFSSKINLAYLVGLVSNEAKKEIVRIKDIRNAFAHHLNIHDFSSQRPAQLASNLNFFEKYMFSQEDCDENARRVSLGIPMENNGKMFFDPSYCGNETAPRSRYVISAMVMIHFLLETYIDGPNDLTNPSF